jgi:hypothetical protein
MLKQAAQPAMTNETGITLCVSMRKTRIMLPFIKELRA